MLPTQAPRSTGLTPPERRGEHARFLPSVAVSIVVGSVRAGSAIVPEPCAAIFLGRLTVILPGGVRARP